MAQYLTAQDAKQLAEESVGLFERALKDIEYYANLGKFEHTFGPMCMSPGVVRKLRELGYVVQPKGEATYISWKQTKA